MVGCACLGSAFGGLVLGLTPGRGHRYVAGGGGAGAGDALAQPKPNRALRRGTMAQMPSPLTIDRQPYAYGGGNAVTEVVGGGQLHGAVEGA